MTTQNLTDIIRGRRSKYPPSFMAKPIPKEVLEEILINATFAPTYMNTQPWRFKVFQGDATEKVGDFIAKAYQKNTPEEDFKEKKYLKIIEKGQLSAAVVAICMQRDPSKRLEEWEEIAAVAMAVQNMWLTAAQHNIGAYWGTPPASKMAHKLFDMNEGERCLGFFFMGYVEEAQGEAKRNTLDSCVDWID